MNILITGGTGFIGKNLIERLTELNHTLLVLTRSHTKAEKLLPDTVHIISSLEDVNFNTTDVVINLAGEPIADKKWTTKHKETICNSRWNITQKITDKINQATTPPTCFISGSAIGYYGRQNDSKITEKFSQYHAEFTHTVCSAWEEKALQADNKTRVCILRTGIVLGINQGALTKMLPPFKLGLGGPIANGYQYMSWIHIDDVVAAIIALMENTQSKGIYNITAPAAVTNEVFCKTLSQTLNRPCLFRVPKIMMKLMLGEMSDLMVYGQNVYPEKLIKEGFNFKYNTLEHALKSIIHG